MRFIIILLLAFTLSGCSMFDKNEKGAEKIDSSVNSEVRDQNIIDPVQKRWKDIELSLIKIKEAKEVLRNVQKSITSLDQKAIKWEINSLEEKKNVFCMMNLKKRLK